MQICNKTHSGHSGKAQDFGEYIFNIIVNKVSFSPFGSRGNISAHILSEDVKMNMILIGAMPNKAIKYIRVHWLLDLPKIIK